MSKKIYIDDELHQELKRVAKERNTSVRKLTDRALRRIIDPHPTMITPYSKRK